ncbi:hypothetical protein [Streptomyces violaceusniger]|uniref:Uncharacterized protein n=1 Tax=Streptomyces violaceusniger (strain Tu 4113) TaxID=653045 RepID=G2PHP8_STRV4|nr:hypothetical protein [Streptomyces violaceusniger]AEM88849.1 hypothetical protein Strvi_0073 [Streptomyces violaceusniger Tu 4113]
MTTPVQLPMCDVGEERSARAWLRRYLAAQPDLFDLRGELARWDAAAEEGRGALRLMSADTLTDFVADRVDTVKVSSSGTSRSVLLPSRLAKALLRTAGAGFRECTGVVRWPIVRPDGTIAANRGYDPATRLVVAPVEDVKPVPDRPTGDDVSAALAALGRLFGAFPYAAPSDYAATLGMYLGPLLRHFLPAKTRSPLHLVTATGPGSGKSYLSAEGLEVLYGARRLSADQSTRELGKTIIAALEKKADTGVIAFDNFATGGRITGAQWARWITEPVISGRVIGTGRTPEIPNDYVWTVNGNQIRVGEDMARRTVVISLASDADDPSQVAHSFDFLEELNGRRGEVLWSLLVLVRNWTAAPAESRTVRAVQLGQFSAWMTAVASILDAAGVEGFNEDRAERMAQMDEQAADYSRFYATVRDLLGGGWLRAAQITRVPVLQDLIPRVEGSEDARIGHRALGRRVLRPQVGRVYGGMKIEERWDNHSKSWVYRVVLIAARRIANAARRVADRVGVVTAAVRMRAAARPERPARTWPQVRGDAERRRQAARGVRVEGDQFARAAAALDGLGPSTA